MSEQPNMKPSSGEANEGVDWTVLPVEALLHIFSFLSLRDRCKAAMACSTFHDVSNTPSLWESMKYCFYVPNQGRCLKCVRRWGQHVRRVWIDLDQGHEYNRRHALDVIVLLQGLATRGVHTVKITFSGDNPCFYSGREFVDALLRFVGYPATELEPRPTVLKHLDLGQMSVALDDHFIDALSECNPQIQIVNLQTYPTFICNVTPGALARFIKRCKALHSFSVYKTSISDEVIKLFLEPNRLPLLKLSLRYTSEDNSSDKVISSETWTTLSKSLASLRVSVTFDETCNCDVMQEVHLNPHMPVSSIQMETTSFIFYGMSDVINDYYKNTLEELVLMTSIKPRAVTLGKALKQVARSCQRLTSLLVFSILDEGVIQELMELSPNLDEQKCFLKSETWLVSTAIQTKHTDVW